MPNRWTTLEEKSKRVELVRLYAKENKPIGEIARVLNLAETSVYDRLIRLGIPVLRSQKPKFNNRRTDIVIPKNSANLAEFVGCLLGDGHLAPTQVMVTLGKKDRYADYVVKMIEDLFGIVPKQIFSRDGDCTVYFGSTEAVKWLKEMGLAQNKVKSQVDVPRWILKSRDFMRAVLRGLFDTDGSVYKLRWGMQISFCNHSFPLIRSVRKMLIILGFSPSKISGYNIYLTRKDDTDKFFQEIGFGNGKHTKRYLKFKNGCVA